MRRTLFLAVALSTVFALVPAGPANALRPVGVRGHDVFDIDFGRGICGFPLTAHVDNTFYIRMYLNNQGDPVRGRSTGRIFVWFTNGDTGATRRLAISGPTFMDADGRIVRGTGSWATFTIDGDFVWATGNMDMDEFGTILRLRGHQRLVCDLVS